jgi:hypothetical protein
VVAQKPFLPVGRKYLILWRVGLTDIAAHKQMFGPASSGGRRHNSCICRRRWGAIRGVESLEQAREKLAAKKLGLPGVKWHLLRHSHAMMLGVVGTSIGTMQSLLEQSAPEITREICWHAILEEQRRAVERGVRLVFGAPMEPSSVSNAEVSKTVH